MQSSLLFSLEEEEEEGEALSLSVGQENNGEGLRHRLLNREGREQGSRLLSLSLSLSLSFSLEDEGRRQGNLFLSLKRKAEEGKEGKALPSSLEEQGRE